MDLVWFGFGERCENVYGINIMVDFSLLLGLSLCSLIHLDRAKEKSPPGV